VFDPSYEVERETSLALLGELAQALDQDELHIAIQPKIGLSKQGTLMAEALMRWEHPERGPQNPGEFVPFAEKTGFITQLTNWMIDSSLQIAAAYLAQGVPMTICVNLSPRDLGSPEFTTYVVERLRAHKLRGSALTLEITEAAIMDGSPVVRQNLDVLWRLGVKIAIDDFGSGYASLEQLRALPLSYIKIDRQYIRGLVNDKASQIMVKSAIALGHALEVEVVAEGVETKEQLDALRSLGCDQAQGYFICKPLPSNEFEAWVRNHASSFGVDSSSLSEAPVNVDGDPVVGGQMSAAATQPARGRPAPQAPGSDATVVATAAEPDLVVETAEAALPDQEVDTKDQLASLDFDIEGPGQS
jgi:EAL domain-containing protein (putative c-di-GMP-specific phosphodiesterase class I)